MRDACVMLVHVQPVHVFDQTTSEHNIICHAAIHPLLRCCHWIGVEVLKHPMVELAVAGNILSNASFAAPHRTSAEQAPTQG